MTKIHCDESGFTGNHLLDAQQPYFVYASTNISNSDAVILLEHLKKEFSIQASEIKAATLMRRNESERIARHVLEAVAGKCIISFYDKKYCLCTKLFEYIFEPVIQSNNLLFYKKNFHRFVSMYFYMLVTTQEIAAEDLAVQFQKFMRTFDPADAPSIFLSARKEESELLGPILDFANGYKSLIEREARVLQKSEGVSAWVLDLTISALFSHLTAWGERHSPITVICDSSKPLIAQAEYLNVMINRLDRPNVSMGGETRPVTWNMTGPIIFSDSLATPEIQVADILAGIARSILSKRNTATDPVWPILSENLHPDCILPDYDHLDLEGIEAPVNWLVLLELATRANNRDDPLSGMSGLYAFAEESCRRGDFHSLIKGE